MADMEQNNQNQRHNVADLLQQIDFLQSQVDGLAGIKDGCCRKKCGIRNKQEAIMVPSKHNGK
jgi:hypothetical protein